MKEEKNKPISKSKAGRFQISIWKRHKTVPASEDTFCPEREYDIVRACIQYSRFNKLKQEYERQQIWCNPDELRNLCQAMDELGKDEGGEQE